MNSREIVRSLVEDLLESRYGAAAILAARGQSIAQRAARQQQQQLKPPPRNPPNKPPNSPLQSLQAKAKHKRQPSNKPFWRATKYLGKKALSPKSALGGGIVLGLGAINPGLGLLAKGIQQSFGDQISEDTSQSPHGTIYGYHNGFWTVNGGPNQPTVSIPSHQVYGHDGVTKIIGKPGMKGRIIKGKKGPAFHSDDSGGPVANPVSKITIGVDYSG